jgi:hypothetical protein
MRAKTIKKGRKSILHLPKLLKEKVIYRQRIAISYSMTLVDDICDPGWSKLWGVSFGHIHLHSSYRFVFRNDHKGLILGYYAYVNGTSPQQNKKYKGEFQNLHRVNPGDVYRMEIIMLNSGVRFQLFNETQGLPYMSDILPKPKSFEWLRTECYPNLKCKQEKDVNFRFLRDI